MNAKSKHLRQWSTVEEIARRGLYLYDGAFEIFIAANIGNRFSSIGTQWANDCDLLFDPNTGRYIELGGGG